MSMAWCYYEFLFETNEIWEKHIEKWGVFVSLITDEQVKSCEKMIKLEKPECWICKKETGNYNPNTQTEEFIGVSLCSAECKEKLLKKSVFKK